MFNENMAQYDFVAFIEPVSSVIIIVKFLSMFIQVNEHSISISYVWWSFRPVFFFILRHKTMWGWGGDKTETINGFECKVYTASGVEILTKTRVEHLNAEDKQAAQSKYLLLLLSLRFEH